MLVSSLPDLERFARRLVGDRSTARDLVQETCCKALVAWSSYSYDSSFRSWLFRILRNLHTDRVRHLKRELLIGDGLDKLSTATTPEHRDAWRLVPDEALERALADIPEILGKPYFLHAKHGRSYADISRELGISPATVGTRLFRARAWLRSRLDPDAVLQQPAVKTAC